VPLRVLQFTNGRRRTFLSPPSSRVPDLNTPYYCHHLGSVSFGRVTRCAPQSTRPGEPWRTHSRSFGRASGWLEPALASGSIRTVRVGRDSEPVSRPNDVCFSLSTEHAALSTEHYAPSTEYSSLWAWSCSRCQPAALPACAGRSMHATAWRPCVCL